MPDQNPPPADFRNQTFQVYLRDVYILNFRQNMQLEFPQVPAAEVETLYAGFKVLQDAAWDHFKKVLYQEISLETARAALRSLDAQLLEANWRTLEALVLEHLMKFSDKTSTTETIWGAFEAIVKAYRQPYVEPEVPDSRVHTPSVPVYSTAAQSIPDQSIPAAPGGKPFPEPVVGATAAMYNKALEFSLEWGENFGKPILERMKKAYPKLTGAEIETIERGCATIKSIAWNAYEAVYNKELSEGEAQQQLTAVFPEISAANLSQLATRGMYYAWHG